VTPFPSTVNPSSIRSATRVTFAPGWVCRPHAARHARHLGPPSRSCNSGGVPAALASCPGAGVAEDHRAMICHIGGIASAYGPAGRRSRPQALGAGQRRGQLGLRVKRWLGSIVRLTRRRGLPVPTGERNSYQPVHVTGRHSGPVLAWIWHSSLPVPSMRTTGGVLVGVSRAKAGRLRRWAPGWSPSRLGCCTLVLHPTGLTPEQGQANCRLRLCRLWSGVRARRSATSAMAEGAVWLGP
jgi:hypothetical protein